jgi:hypothetical protein
VFLYAFDLLELDGVYLRREPIETRRAELANLLRNARPGLRLSEHVEGDGATVYEYAVVLGCEGVVNKRKGLALHLGPLAGLDQDQEPGRASGAAQGGGGLEPMTLSSPPRPLFAKTARRPITPLLVRLLGADSEGPRSRPIDTQAEARAPRAQRGRKSHSLYVRFAPTAALVDTSQRSAAL